MSLELDRRLARLEGRVRHLGVLSLGLAVLAIVGFARGTDPTPDLLQARRVQVVDANGLVRIDLWHDSTGTGMFIKDTTGQARVGAAQFSHGGGGYALHGPAGKGGAVLYLKGRGTLTMFDSAGTVTARFPEPAAAP